MDQLTKWLFVAFFMAIQLPVYGQAAAFVIEGRKPTLAKEGSEAEAAALMSVLRPSLTLRQFTLTLADENKFRQLEIEILSSLPNAKQSERTSAFLKKAQKIPDFDKLVSTWMRKAFGYSGCYMFSDSVVLNILGFSDRNAEVMSERTATVFSDWAQGNANRLATEQTNFMRSTLSKREQEAVLRLAMLETD